ncbi:MAG: ABC transporter permease subunit [Verrucomicrobiota bacterium]|nr:ABC transporter permease subunit [Verrucomicrobiota bacterium]
MRRRALNIILPAATGALFIALWHLLHQALSEDSRFLLPAPADVLSAFRENGDALARATLNTTEGALLGFGGAVVVSLILALALSLSRLVRVSLYPYLMILQMTPVIVFAPMLVVWVGPGLASVAIITFLICFFPLVVNTTQGLISTDRNLVELFRLYRARRWQEVWFLRMPAALPYFFTGLRIAATLAPIGALVGDYTAGSSAGNGGGLGFQTIIYSSQARYPALFATAAVTCALGFIFVAVVLALSWLTLHKWHDSFERTDV